MRLGLTLILSTFVADAAVNGAAIGDSSVARHVPVKHSEREEEYAQDLWKRRGGGGGGGRGGGSSSGGSSSGSGSSGSGSSSSSGSGRGSSSSSTGGATKSGSGPAPRFGGGSVYAGGARQPYRSGSTSPSGISPLFLGAGLGALAFFPLLAWPHGAYFYPYAHPYGFYNSSSGRNESKPVQCACDPDVECGCDDDGTNTTTTVLSELIGNGSYANLNMSEVNVANNTIFINGTLPNGTTAAGGTDDANSGAGMRFFLQNAGWWPVVATVAAAVFIS